MSCTEELPAGRGELQIRFERQGDRYSHALFSGSSAIGRSIEGDGHQEWPTSPPLQQLSIEDLGNGPVGLLVGMAGRSHWSMSVEGEDDSFVFDVACRVRGATSFLGSTYQLDGFQIAPTGDQFESDAQAVDLLNQDGRLTIRVDDDDSAASGQISWDQRTHALQITAAAVPAGVETCRWRYHIRWRRAAERSG